ncbi:TIGR02594 family protein [Vineibacter terrae]|uniref:TIGR02594 family protein n=1 Tax=Vineibacter terrae TaxID=2586908 RepID=UPI002E328EEB|nr:TIGR02594 family protein [Vineibacter terrae]HEX2887825.1 TIGR02594 family protein [Vineibacter terrae]
MAKYRVVEASAAVRSALFFVEANVVGQFAKDRVFEGERVEGVSPFVRIIDPSPPGPNAFILENSVQEIVAQVTPEPIAADEHETFCRLVTRAARKHGPERDYLMAAAYASSRDLADFGTAQSRTIGPFQISAEDWTEAITTGVAKNLGFSEGDRYLWYRQPVVAALRAADHVRRLMAPAALGREPTFTELYFAELFGPGAEAILKGDLNRLCSVAISGDPATGSYAAGLKAGGKTVAAVLGELQAGLVKGLTKALEVIDAQPPEIRFFRTGEMKAPWLAVAQAEMDRIVVEIPGDRNHDRIALYHRTAGVVDTRDETPWCGSFVTYCMAASGVPAVAASVPASPALARSWEGWGRAVAGGEAKVGSVVVLQPGGPGTGHVGFLVEDTGDGFIRVLGGNQGTPNQVGIVRFPVTQIVARRWLDVASALSGAQLQAIFPECEKRDIWANAISAAWQRFGIATRSARAGFLAIVGTETGGNFEVTRENMNYTPARAAQVWPGRASAGGFPTQTCRERIAAGPQAFANWIYAGVNGNGDEASGDGFKYRGGGIIQLTGRANYKACADGLGLPDLMQQPDLLTDPQVSAAAAAWYMAEGRKMLPLLNNDSEADFLAAANRVGLSPDGAAFNRRLAFRRKALTIL